MTETIENALTMTDVMVQFGETVVLENVTASLAAGTLVGVVGPNGAGKSTLFNAIAGLVPLHQGEILVHGLPSAKVRGRLAYVPQKEDINWRFPLTAKEVVLLGRVHKSRRLKNSNSNDRNLVDECLHRVGMWELRNNLVSDLSGGQRQRVFVARALAQEADILMLDEAFSGVDFASQESLVGALRELRDEGKTILLATHDLTRLSERFDTVLCINRHVCAFGPPDTAFTPEVLEELYGAHGVSFAEGGHIH
jgi:manganese/zinc/iron transport system ATP- binding protein